MQICFFGTYAVAEGYPVNRVLVKGARLAGASVVECREELWGPSLYRAYRGSKLRLALRLAWRMPAAYLRLAWQFWRRGSADWVIVGYAGYLDIHLARLLCLGRKRRLALVSFISLFDTLVRDRAVVAEDSWRARCIWLVDRMAFRAADVVLVDTEEQGKYYADLFRLPRELFVRSLVGEDDGDFPPAPPTTREGAMEVLFYGTYVPLHGIDTILEAAEIVGEDSGVHFTLIGSGQLHGQLRSQAEARGLGYIRFVDTWVSPRDLSAHIAEADVCLGIFGTTPKAARVVPYKVYDALAVGRPVITRDSPAARELLAHGRSAILCEAGSGRALAAAILQLRDDPEMRLQLAADGHQVYRERGCPVAIGRELVANLGRWSRE
ncbi:glycosyltransferase [Candidatus Latescibacterota bacterium]